MHYHQVWLIEVEEDLETQTIQSIKPISNNDEAKKKQSLPISMVWREGRLFNSNDIVLKKQFSPISRDWREGRLFNSN